MANIKVFSVALYRELTSEQGELPSWIINCEGLTKQQCTDACAFFSDVFFVDVEGMNVRIDDSK